MINYTNLRIVLTKDGFYSITEANYNTDGEIDHIHYQPKPILGYSLQEVAETLESLLQDIKNWKEEELKEGDLLRLMK